MTLLQKNTYLIKMMSASQNTLNMIHKIEGLNVGSFKKE